MVFDPFGDFDTRGYLRNLHEIRNAELMKETEHIAFKAHVEEALVALALGTPLRYQDVLDTHQRFFDSVYPWAGQDRTNVLADRMIGKGGDFDLFAHPRDAQRAMDYALQLGQEATTLRRRPGEVMGYLAYAHPFLEGNGRTIMTVHAELMRRVNRHIDWTGIGKHRYLAALTEELRTPRQGKLDAVLQAHVREGGLKRSQIAARAQLHPPAMGGRASSNAAPPPPGRDGKRRHRSGPGASSGWITQRRCHPGRAADPSPVTRARREAPPLEASYRIEHALAGRVNIARFVVDLIHGCEVNTGSARLDDWADQVSRLSDAEVKLNRTAEGLVALARAKVITVDQAIRLNIFHFEQRQQA